MSLVAHKGSTNIETSIVMKEKNDHPMSQEVGDLRAYCIMQFMDHFYFLIVC